MKNIKSIALCLALVLLLAGLSGCAAPADTTEPGGDAEGFSGKIYIGSIDPMTGGSASYGVEEMNGKTMAVEEINAAGGVLGMEVVLVGEDSASQPSQAATVATKLITKDQVAAIAGAHNSSETLAMMEVLTEYGIPAVCPSTSPKIGSSGNEWINRCSPDDQLQAKLLAKYAKETSGCTKLGFLYANDDYGKGGFGAAAEASTEYGIEIIGESFMADDQNFTTQLTKLKDAGCDGIMMWCTYTPAALILKQADEMGWDVQFFAGPGVNNPQLFELSNGLCEGMIFVTSFASDYDDAYIQDWVARYRTRWGVEPALTASHGYDSIKIICDAITAAGSTEPAAIRDAIRNLKDYQCLKGIASIDPATGNMDSPCLMVVANNETKTFDYIGAIA